MCPTSRERYHPLKAGRKEPAVAKIDLACRGPERGEHNRCCSLAAADKGDPKALLVRLDDTIGGKRQEYLAKSAVRYAVARL